MVPSLGFLFSLIVESVWFLSFFVTCLLLLPLFFFPLFFSFSFFFFFSLFSFFSCATLSIFFSFGFPHAETFRLHFKRLFSVSYLCHSDGGCYSLRGCGPALFESRKSLLLYREISSATASPSLSPSPPSTPPPPSPRDVAAKGQGFKQTSSHLPAQGCDVDMRPRA